MSNLREALEAAFDEPSLVETPEPSPEPAPASEPSSSVPAPQEPEAPKAEEPSKPTEPVPEQETARVQAPATPESVPPAGSHRVDRPPQSWKQDAKGEWANLPLPARREIHRRESEVDRVLMESHQARALAQEFTATMTPYLERCREYNVTPLQAAKELFEADRILSTSSKERAASHMAKLIKDYNIDIEALDNALVGNAPAGSDDIEQRVLRQVQHIVGPILAERQAASQRSEAQTLSEVEAMSLDNVKYPYFEEVRADMADLIDLAARRGLYLSLDEAYTRAVRLDPEKTPQAHQVTPQSLHEQAQQAKAAAKSVSGAPVSDVNPKPSVPADASLRAVIESAFVGTNRV